MSNELVVMWEQIDATSSALLSLCLSARRAPQFLVPVHVAVGDAEELAHVAAVFRMVRHADADAAANHPGAQIQRCLIDIMSYPFDHGLGDFRRCAGEQHREFVAAEAGGKVGAADATLKALGDQHQGAVP